MLDDIRKLLVRELRSLGREIELFPDEASVWTTPAGLTNSAGNLVLHVCGNLKHFVGAVLGRTGYVRDREHEFAARGVARAEILREVEETISVVSEVLGRLSGDVLDAPFPEAHGGVQLSGRMFLLHVSTHAAFHLGQVGYVRRVVTGDSASSGPLPIRALAEAR
jgi:hypothetical protein